MTGGFLSSAGAFCEPFFIADGTSVALDPAVFGERLGQWRELAGAPSTFDRSTPKLIVSLGTASPLLYGNPMWKSYSTTDSSKAFVTSGVLDRIVEGLQAQVLAFFRQVQHHGVLAAAVAAPAPQARHRAVDWLGTEGVLDLDQSFRDPVRALLEDLGVPLLGVGVGTAPDGFLQESFWGPNWSHANASWGSAVLDEIAALGY
ncbi:MAG: hypothetical protein PHU75_00290 [Candidatus Nanopelagicales bacterium]|nr:hypothetical protein [Candidatus Nanopelagicales bacterium]